MDASYIKQWRLRSKELRAEAERLTYSETTNMMRGIADDYLRIANRLCGDPAWRYELSMRIAENSTRLFDDPSPIAALDAFYTDAVARPSP